MPSISFSFFMEFTRKHLDFVRPKAHITIKFPRNLYDRLVETIDRESTLDPFVHLLRANNLAYSLGNCRVTSFLPSSLFQTSFKEIKEREF